MAARFEIVLNGERVCISGLDGDGVLTTMVNFVKHSNTEGEYELSIGGHGRFLPTHDRPQHADWPNPSVAIGDEITIRILPDGDFDLPQNMIGSPRESIIDAQFGKLNYSIDAWDGDLEINCQPFNQCHVHLWSTADGPSNSQRERLTGFLDRHDSLWPLIAESLVRCHTDINTISELADRIHPRICINMQPDGSDIEVTYTVEGDPELRAYFVTLRNWEIAEVCAAE